MHPLARAAEGVELRRALLAEPYFTDQSTYYDPAREIWHARARRGPFQATLSVSAEALDDGPLAGLIVAQLVKGMEDYMAGIVERLRERQGAGR